MKHIYLEGPTGTNRLTKALTFLIIIPELQINSTLSKPLQQHHQLVKELTTSKFTKMMPKN